MLQELCSVASGDDLEIAQTSFVWNNPRIPTLGIGDFLLGSLLDWGIGMVSGDECKNM
jgi:hypothetical protein